MEHIKSVNADKIYRIFNIGATCIVSAEHEGVADAMPAAWNTCLDLVPCKAVVVIDKIHFTRPLVEKSGCFALQFPTAGVARETMYLGSVSKNDNAKKLEESGAEFFKMPGCGVPLMKGCAAWVLFKRVARPENEQDFDLFIGEAVAAWADERVFKDGHWLFETAPEELKTLHYVAGGHFYRIGEALDVPDYDE